MIVEKKKRIRGAIWALVLMASIGVTTTSVMAEGEAEQEVVERQSATMLVIDGERSRIDWISDAPAEKIVGTGEGLAGEVSWDPEALESTRGRIWFPVESMKTGNSLRDRHLKGRDWLRASENPNIIFHIEGLEVLEETRQEDQIRVRAVAVGSVEVNGERAPTRANVEIAILPETRRARIQPEFEIRLEDHQIRGRRGAVGSEVGETIQISGVLYGGW